MNRKQIEALREKEYRENNIVRGEGSCQQMIISCLEYGYSKQYFMDNYAKDYLSRREKYFDKAENKIKYDKEGFCKTLDDVAKVWDDQANYFRNHCSVSTDTYTDSDGLSYNSVIDND